MIGKVLGYSAQTGSGVIVDEQGQRHIFSTNDWMSSTPAKRGDAVDFILGDEGAALQIFPAVSQSQTASGDSRAGKRSDLWLAALSVVAGVISLMIVLFDDEGWDRDTVAGFFMLVLIGLAAGIGTLSNGLLGRRVAISGIVINSLAGVIGLLSMLN